MNNALVSIIVSTKNSSKFLEKCLESIKSQTYKNLEIIVVDNNSTDNTKEIAKSYTDKVYNFGPERSAQVNYGVSKAAGEFVYKVDSDFVLDKNVVKECIDKMNKGFDAVVVHNTPDETISWIAKIRKFEVDMYKYDITHSSARFLKKDVYDAINGFNENMTAGEDYDFQNRLNESGYKVGFIDAEALHLGEPTNFWRHMKKYYAYGKDFVNYKRENSEESKKQLRFYRSVYFKNWKKFIKHPLLGAEFICYDIFKFGFGGIGYFVSLIFGTKEPTRTLMKEITKIIFSPHYDDATFSLGGMIASDPTNCIVVTVFARIPDANVDSWWDKKCGFKNSIEAMDVRRIENKKSLECLGLSNDRIIDLQELEKQYRPENLDRANLKAQIINVIYSSRIKNILASKSVEIFAPLNTINEDHSIVQDIAFELGRKNGQAAVYLYEDMPYQVMPSSFLQRRDTTHTTPEETLYENIIFGRKLWLRKQMALRQYKTQFVGRAKYIERVVCLYNKWRALLIGMPFSYAERVAKVNLYKIGIHDPLVSVIVPTKNSAVTIENCLKSIRNQTYRNIEIIVVDNFSTDDTQKIAQKYTHNVFVKGPERSAQRNYGAQRSLGEYVLFIDSDMQLSENVIISCVQKIKSNKRHQGIIIPEESFGTGFWAKCKKLERSFYIGVDWMEAARFFDKNVFLEVGGYDKELVGGEDWDLSQRVRKIYRVERIPELIFHDEGNPSLYKIVRKKFKYAKQFTKYTKKQNNSENMRKQTGILSRYQLFFSNPKKLFSNPIIGIGMLFMKTCEFGFGGVGYLNKKL